MCFLICKIQFSFLTYGTSQIAFLLPQYTQHLLINGHPALPFAPLSEVERGDQPPTWSLGL